MAGGGEFVFKNWKDLRKRLCEVTESAGLRFEEKTIRYWDGEPTLTLPCVSLAAAERKKRLPRLLEATSEAKAVCVHDVVVAVDPAAAVQPDAAAGGRHLLPVFGAVLTWLTHRAAAGAPTCV